MQNCGKHFVGNYGKRIALEMRNYELTECPEGGTTEFGSHGGTD